MLTQDNRELKNDEKTLADYKLQDMSAIMVELSRRQLTAAEEEAEEARLTLSELHFDSRKNILQYSVRYLLGGLALDPSLVDDSKFHSAKGEKAPSSSKKANVAAREENVTHQFLAVSSNFAQLYKLLSMDVEVGREVLKLLSLVPVPEDIASKLRNPSQPWPKLLSAKSAFQFVYQLEVVESLLKDPSWAVTFKESEGWTFLQSYVSNVDDLDSDPARRRGFAVVLRILNSLFQVPSDKDTSKFLASFKFKDLGPQLYHLIGKTAAQCTSDDEDYEDAEVKFTSAKLSS
jgi:hypothetical protein